MDSMVIKMKNVKIILVLIASLVIFTTGCDSQDYDIKRETNEQCSELLDCLSKNDPDGIKELFCTAVSNSKNFDDDVLKAVAYFDGEVSSYDIKSIGSDEKSENGKVVTIHISPKLWDVETSTGKNYKISYYAYLVNSDNPEYIGISEILIKCSDGTEFKLGDYSISNPQ